MAMDLSKLPMPKKGGGEEEPMVEIEIGEEEAGKVPGKGMDLTEVDDATLMAEMEKRGFSVVKSEQEEGEGTMEAPEEEDLFMEEEMS